MFTARENVVRGTLLCRLTDPCPVQVDRDEGGRDGEVVDERVVVQHEPELVAGGEELQMQHFIPRSCCAHFQVVRTHPYKKVDHEENVESEIDLLGQVFAPGNALFHAFAVNRRGNFKKILVALEEPFSGSSPGGVYEVND